MKEFTQSMGFIIFVLCMVLGVSMAFGETFATYFLWLVLLSMMVVNADKVTAFIGRFSTPGGNTSKTSPGWSDTEFRGGMMS